MNDKLPKCKTCAGGWRKPLGTKMTEGGLSPWVGKIPKDCPPSGTWLTNIRSQYDCAWPIRIGDPKATEGHSSADLRKMGLRGVYVA